MMLGGDKGGIESSQINKRSRSRGLSANKGKSLTREDNEEDEMSMSMENIFSMEESSNNNKAQRRKQKKIAKASKGPRRMWTIHDSLT